MPESLVLDGQPYSDGWTSVSNQNAASIASLMLTTEAMICEVREEADASA